MPDAAKSCGQSRGGAHQFSLPVLWPMQQKGVAGMPDLFLPLAVAPGAHLFIDRSAVRRKSQLTQGNQVSFAEKVFNSPLPAWPPI